MGLLSGLTDILTGGFAKQAVDVVTKYFPPDLTPEQKSQIELAMQNLALEKQRELDSAVNEAEKTLNERIAMYEGSASDLKSMPVLGNLMLFLRGSQRIAWGFAVIYLDYCVFSSAWKITDPVISNAFWVVNILVLGFLFGERAITNIMPFVTQFMAVKKG